MPSFLTTGASYEAAADSIFTAPATETAALSRCPRPAMDLHANTESDVHTGAMHAVSPMRTFRAPMASCRPKFRPCTVKAAPDDGMLAGARPVMTHASYEKTLKAVLTLRLVVTAMLTPTSTPAGSTQVREESEVHAVRTQAKSPASMCSRARSVESLTPNPSPITVIGSPPFAAPFCGATCASVGRS